MCPEDAIAWNTHSESGTHRRSAHRVTGTLKCRVGGSKNTSFHPKCDGRSQRVSSRVAGWCLCSNGVALKGVGTEMGRDQLGGSILHTEPQKKPVLEGSGQNRDKALSSGTLGSPC